MKRLVIRILVLSTALLISCGESKTKVEETVNKVKPETEKVWRSLQ